MGEIIFEHSFLSIVIFVVLIWLRLKNKLGDRKFFVLMLIVCIFVYSRYIEPNLILLEEKEIDVGFKSRVLIVSDLHIGVFKNRSFLKKVVKKINNVKNIDAVLIAGDFTYNPKEKLDYLFEPLSEIRFPVYAVLGNHDCQRPGQPIKEELKKVLIKNKITVLENEFSFLKNKNLYILGLGSHMAQNDDISKIYNFSEKDNLIVIAHNPDTTMHYNSEMIKRVDFTISGHTHGGQVRIPFLYKHFIPSNFDFDKGLYDICDNFNCTKVFINSGVGEIGLPFRFMNPPKITVLNIY